MADQYTISNRMVPAQARFVQSLPLYAVVRCCIGRPSFRAACSKYVLCMWTLCLTAASLVLSHRKASKALNFGSFIAALEKRLLIWSDGSLGISRRRSHALDCRERLTPCELDHRPTLLAHAPNFAVAPQKWTLPSALFFNVSA